MCLGPERKKKKPYSIRQAYSSKVYSCLKYTITNMIETTQNAMMLNISRI